MTERKYIVLTDSPHACDNRVLAHVEPQRVFRCQTWWTDKPGGAWQMNRETAEQIAKSLSFNNPRFVRAEKALGLLHMQHVNLHKEGPTDGRTNVFLLQSTRRLDELCRTARVRLLRRLQGRRRQKRTRRNSKGRPDMSVKAIVWEVDRADGDEPSIIVYAKADDDKDFMALDPAGTGQLIMSRDEMGALRDAINAALETT